MLFPGDRAAGGRQFEFRAPFPGAAALDIKAREYAGKVRK
jgi:hypothetical protein